MTAAGAPLLQIRDLAIEFATGGQSLAVVRGASFELRVGEVLAIVGESGAGKSITGTAINRLIEPPGRIAGGEIRFQGRRIDDLPEREFRRLRGRHIGMVFQDHQSSLDPLRTVGEELVETIRGHSRLSRRGALARAVALLAEVGIPEERLRSYPHELSGGLRQRVAIALALAPSPELLIADEPTTALDVSVQAQILTLLDRIRRDREMSIVFITHDIGVAAEIADRIAVMYAGRIVECGPADEVIRRPLHPYTRALMDAVPSIERRAAQLTQIPGAPPRLGQVVKGCSFHPRCPVAHESCWREQPPRFMVGAAEVECVLYEAPAVRQTKAAGER